MGVASVRGRRPVAFFLWFVPRRRARPDRIAQTCDSRARPQILVFQTRGAKWYSFLMNALELGHLDPSSFEHLAMALALRELGAGATNFGPGPDGGRDVLFEGTAAYPNLTNQWSGIWYLQSKFMLSTGKNPQQWLHDQIKSELEEFKTKRSRKWPDNWIIITNIEQSGKPETGLFDKARKLVSSYNPKLSRRFHIWGGSKVLELLATHPLVADRYRHLMTPGNIIAKLLEQLDNDRASANDLVEHLVVREHFANTATRLNEAGSEGDNRPLLHELFVDLPYSCETGTATSQTLSDLLVASANNHRGGTPQQSDPRWKAWNTNPRRSGVWFIKGGPGQGKSTISQYLCQTNRSRLISQNADRWSLSPEQLRLANEFLETAPQVSSSRIPIQIDLKQFARWHSAQDEHAPKGVLSYVANKAGRSIEKTVTAGLVRRALETCSWLIAFDGLDEVPGPSKDQIAEEVVRFTREASVFADVLVICTSRPQGYSGQFDQLPNCAHVRLTHLPNTIARECAEKVLLRLPEHERLQCISVLEDCMRSPSVVNLMATPLQSHIMAVLIRSGHRPPDRKWELYERFYQVMHTRELSRDLQEPGLAAVLKNEFQLIRAIHNRLGFVLHAHAEKATGAEASLSRDEFRKILRETISDRTDHRVEEMTELLSKATTERLVFINTPDNGESVRFDIRQIQEFFAAEFVRASETSRLFDQRFMTICGDPHWSEVVHFAVSALVVHSEYERAALASAHIRALDDGPGSEVMPLQRAMGRGGFIVASLLADGALDSDRRFRTLFEPSVELFLTTRDADEVAAELGRTTWVNTKRWLAVVAGKLARTLDRRKLAAPTAMVLTSGQSDYLQLLGFDDDDQMLSLCGGLVGLLENSPQIAPEVFAMCCRSIKEGRTPGLFSHGWAQDSGAFINKLMADAIGKDDLNLLARATSACQSTHSDKATPIGRGLFELRKHRRVADGALLSEIDLFTAKAMSPGPEFIAIACALLLQPTPGRLRSLVERLKSRPHLLELVSSYEFYEISRGLPQFTGVDVLTDEALSEWISEHLDGTESVEVGRVPANTLTSTEIAQEWAAALALSEESVMSLYVHDFRFAPGRSTPEVASAVLDQILKTSTPRYLPTATWPAIATDARFDQYLALISQQALTSESAMEISVGAISARHTENPPAINLRQHPGLIIHVAREILLSLGILAIRGRHFGVEPDTARSASSQIAGFFPDIREVAKLCLNAKVSEACRCAASLVWLAHPLRVGFDLLKTNAHALVELARESPNWTIALLAAADCSGTQDHETVAALAADLLAQADLGNTLGLARPILTQWSQRSNSPVSKFGLERLLHASLAR